MKAVVYYDDKGYHPSWIDMGWDKKIAEHLRRKDFQQRDAKGLESWLRNRLAKRDAYSSVIVFSQDMVPETVLDGLNSSNSHIRRYLDVGGRVVWIGDVPFWSKAVIREDKDREEIFISGVPFAMLGVEPLIAESSSLCEWAEEWSKSMKSRWYSQRPVNIEWVKGVTRIEHMNVEVKPLAFARVTLLPCGWNSLVITRWKKAGKKVGEFGLQALGFGGTVTLTEKFPEELSYKPRKLACAWHISFDENFPRQGFYRFWDCGVTDKDPPKELLDDIYTLATLDLE